MVNSCQKDKSPKDVSILQKMLYWIYSLLKLSIWTPCLCFDIIYCIKYFSGIISLISYTVCHFFRIFCHCFFVIITYYMLLLLCFLKLTFHVNLTMLANEGDWRTLQLPAQSLVLILVLYVVFYLCYFPHSRPPCVLLVNRSHLHMHSNNK